MQPAHRRHDVSDRVWSLLDPHLPGRKGVRGVTARDNRLFCQRCVLDIAYRSALEGSAAGLWGLEKHTSQVLSLARQRRLGKAARNPCDRTGL
jgi:hypothetical protein